MPKRLRRATPRNTGRPPTIRLPLRKDSFPATGGKDRRQTRNASDGFLRHLRQDVRREPLAAHRAKIHRRGERTAGEEPFPDVLSPENRGEEPFRSLRKRSSARRNGSRCRFSNRLRSFRPRKIPARKDRPHARSLQRVRRGVLSGRDERNAGREPRNRHRPPRPRTSVASASRKARKRPEPHTKNPALFRERDLSKARRNSLIRS